MVFGLVVSFEVLVGFLKGLLLYAADETFALLVLLDLMAALTELGEGVDQNAAYDVAEKHVHEDGV